MSLARVWYCKLFISTIAPGSYIEDGKYAQCVFVEEQSTCLQTDNLFGKRGVENRASKLERNDKIHFVGDKESCTVADKVDFARGNKEGPDDN